MKNLLFLLLCLCCATGAGAQYSDSVHYHVNYSSTGAINKTNDGDSYLLSNGLKLGVRQKRLSLNWNNNWVYGQQNRKLTNNDFLSSLDFNLYSSLPHFYYWGLATYNTSYSLKIRNQFQAGLGAAYNVVDQPNAVLNLSDGFLYEYGDLIQNDTARDTYHTWRNSLRVQFRWTIREIVSLNGNAFWQPSLSDSHDYIVRSNVNLSLKLRKWLSLTTGFTYNRFNRTQRENMLITYGLTIDQYF